MSLKSDPHAEAWLLPLEQGLWAAIGVAELFYLIDQPPLYFIPCAPRHCCHLLVWEGLLLPLANPSLLLLPQTALPSDSARLAAVTGYLQADGSTAYGAVRLADVPRRIEVSDGMRCALPHPAWASTAHTTFLYQQQPVAVIALERLFAAVSP